jgi:hypothetical protein
MSGFPPLARDLTAPLVIDLDGKLVPFSIVCCSSGQARRRKRFEAPKIPVQSTACRAALACHRLSLLVWGWVEFGRRASHRADLVVK